MIKTKINILDIIIAIILLVPVFVTNNIIYVPLIFVSSCLIVKGGHGYTYKEFFEQIRKELKNEPEPRITLYGLDERLKRLEETHK